MYSTSGIYLYCNTLTFAAPSVSALFCNYISTYKILSAVTATALTPTIIQFAAMPTTSVATNTSSTASHSSTATATPAPSTGNKTFLNKGKVIGGVLGGLAGLALVVFLVILFLRWRNSEEPEPVKEGILVNGSNGKGVAVSTSEVSQNSALAEKKISVGKKVRVVG
jgi:beta-lactamase regulating signal transducer with metallopeptidase domain